MKNEIKASANHKNRTFTLREYSIERTGIFYAKYRTFKMTKQEFNSCLYNTTLDWLHWFKCDEYSVIRSGWIKSNNNKR